MANFDNLSVKKLQEEMAALKEQGFWDGIAYDKSPLPALYYKRPFDMSPYEIGYLTGYLMGRVERDLGSEGIESRLDSLDAVGPADIDRCPGPD